MKIRFVTLGCKLNFAESSAIGKALLEQGHIRAKQGEEADICVINTCSVTDNADHKDRQVINRIHRQNPNAIIIVTGCYAQLQPEQIAQIEGVDYVLGQNEKYSITQLVDELCDSLKNGVPPTGRPTGCSLEAQKIRVANIREVDEFHGAFSKDDRTRCFLKVQDGCNYFCTYCTIPYARGKSRNPKIADVVIAAQQALAEGAKELVLTGVNIGDFGRSTGESFIDLLKALDCLETPMRQAARNLHKSFCNDSDCIATAPHFGNIQNATAESSVNEARGERLEAKGMDYRIRISSCEPNLLTDEIIDFVAQSKHFAPHFHIPLQSGSNEVLQIMKRRYTRELFEERVKHIKQVMPHAFIGVDCMVGVRGETEEYFNDYVEFIKQLNISQLHVFTYSERANTRMLELDVCIVPKTERQRRSKILHEISEEKTKTFYAEQIGREAVVLWESKKEGDQMAGFTENYVKVYRPYDRAKVNTFEVVRL
jgi:threonylcarbamoyladenosine tRNA methylthiotransferase MtaB